MKNTLKAELHQAFHNRFFYISFFLCWRFPCSVSSSWNYHANLALTYGDNTDLMKMVHR